MTIVRMDRTLPTPFGRYLRKLRVDREEKQNDMATKLKMSGAMLSAIELGKRDPTDRLATLVSVVYGLNKAESKKLQELVLISQNTLRISLVGKSEKDKELIILFFSKFDKLTDDQKSWLKVVLNDEGKVNG